jgi:hypothetical protein
MRTLQTYAKRNYITLVLCAVALIALVGSGLSSASGPKDYNSTSNLKDGRRLSGVAIDAGNKRYLRTGGGYTQ